MRANRLGRSVNVSGEKPGPAGPDCNLNSSFTLSSAFGRIAPRFRSKANNKVPAIRPLASGGRGVSQRLAVHLIGGQYMTKVSRFTLLSLAIAALLIPSFGFAQTTANTGAIIGTVTDSSGGVLPGVTVTVTGPSLQGSRTATTDSKGEYLVPLLPPGTYKAEYALSGLKPVVQQGIVVNATVSSKQDAKLALGVSETMTVTASQIVVDPTQTTQQQAFKEDHLKDAAIGQQRSEDP